MLHTNTQEGAQTELGAEIRILLIEMGAVTHIKGFAYLCRAIEIVHDEPDAIHNVMNGLYARIAEEAGTSPSCVERDIRSELKVILSSGSFAVLDESFSHFGFRAKGVSARKFIALFAEKLRNHLIKPGSRVFRDI